MELPLPRKLVLLALDAAVGVGKNPSANEVDTAQAIVAQIHKPDAQVKDADGQQDTAHVVELLDPGVKIAVKKVSRVILRSDATKDL